MLMARIYTDEAVKRAAEISRKDYKTIKHMDKATLAAYLSRVWKRGYDAGYQAAVKSVAPQLREAAELKAADKEG
jgi:ABC-type polysaccharide transport system permease subunit